MAQTKHKRQTKHRGNAAGVIESRGRTGRPPSAEEKKRAVREDRRAARLNREPTLKSSSMRGLLAGVFMFLFVAVTDKPKHGGSPIAAAAIFAVIATVLYVFVGYALEHYFWRRRMAKKRQGQTG